MCVNARDRAREENEVGRTCKAEGVIFTVSASYSVLTSTVRVLIQNVPTLSTEKKNSLEVGRHKDIT